MEQQTLPRGWAKTILGQTVTLSKEKVEPVDFNNRKYVGLEHIESNTGIITSYGNSGSVQSTKNVFAKGDILYGRLRPYLNKVCIPDFGGICSTDILVLKPHKFIVPSFLYLCLRTMDFVQFATIASQGVNLPRVKFSTIENYQISLPPHNEQKRIVSKIESIFAKIDAAEVTLKTVQTLTKQLRQAVLKMAFEGRLVPQDPNDTPAKCLLENTTEQNDGGTLPAGWLKTTLGQVVELSKNKIEPKKSNAKKYIGLEHIESDTGRIIGNGISSDVKSTKSTFNSGDILYGRLRPYLNKVCIPEFSGICSTDILVLKPHKFMSTLFLCLYLQTPGFVRFATDKSQGVNLPRIKFSMMRKYVVSLPPLNEQKRIILKTESVLDQIDTIDTHVTKLLFTLVTMRKSVLKLAFEGRLVSQDPRDEPARTLLERTGDGKHA